MSSWDLLSSKFLVLLDSALFSSTIPQSARFGCLAQAINKTRQDGQYLQPLHHSSNVKSLHMRVTNDLYGCLFKPGIVDGRIFRLYALILLLHSE